MLTNKGERELSKDQRYYINKHKQTQRVDVQKSRQRRLLVTLLTEM